MNEIDTELTALAARDPERYRKLLRQREDDARGRKIGARVADVVLVAVVFLIVAVILAFFFGLGTGLIVWLFETGWGIVQ